MCAKAEASVWKFFARTRSKTFSESSPGPRQSMLTANRNMAKPICELNTRGVYGEYKLWSINMDGTLPGTSSLQRNRHYRRPKIDSRYD